MYQNPHHPPLLKRRAVEEPNLTVRTSTRYASPVARFMPDFDSTILNNAEESDSVALNRYVTHY